MTGNVQYVRCICSTRYLYGTLMVVEPKVKSRDPAISATSQSILYKPVESMSPRPGMDETTASYSVPASIRYVIPLSGYTDAFFVYMSEVQLSEPEIPTESMVTQYLRVAMVSGVTGNGRV